jgi:hypothetical protein
MPETTLFIQGEMGQLEAIFTPPTSTQFVLIFCHPHPLQGGTMHNKVVTTVIRAAENKGLGTLRFNFRGVGKSEGSYSDALGEQNDLLTVIDWLNKKYPEFNYVLGGFSFGSFIAFAVAGSRQELCTPKMLLLIAPPVQYPLFWELPSPACPSLIVQGLMDEVVIAERVKIFHETKLPKACFVSFPEAGHFFHGKLIELRDVVERFINDNPF